MGREARANHRRWRWLYERSRLRRAWIAVKFFYTARRRQRLRGHFWSRLMGRGEMPKRIA